jgi:hypothetical protein
MGHNKADAVRSVRPKGKKCRWPPFPTLHLKGNLKILLEKFYQQCQDKFLILLK